MCHRLFSTSNHLLLLLSFSWKCNVRFSELNRVFIIAKYILVFQITDFKSNLIRKVIHWKVLVFVICWIKSLWDLNNILLRILLKMFLKILSIKVIFIDSRNKGWRNLSLEKFVKINLFTEWMFLNLFKALIKADSFSLIFLKHSKDKISWFVW